jgi:DNA-binding PadR family transcriptional regulator
VAWYEVSYDTLQAVDFPFWSTKTIARTCRRLEKRGIITARPMSRNTYDRTKWYTINDAKLQEALGSTSGQSVPLEGTASPHHEADNVSPSLKEEKREKKEPEGQVTIEVAEEDSLPAEEPQAAAADTPPEGAAPQAETHTTEIPVASQAPEEPGAATHQRAELPAPSQQDPGKPGDAGKTAPTEKQQACPHPFAEVVTLTGGITVCNHCFGLVSFDPLAEAA